MHCAVIVFLLLYFLMKQNIIHLFRRTVLVVYCGSYTAHKRHYNDKNKNRILLWQAIVWLNIIASFLCS